MELVLLRNEWISLFGDGTFQRYVFMLSKRFIRISENGLSHKTWSDFLFAQHARRTYWSGYVEHACDEIIFFLMLETEESIFDIDSHHTLQEAYKLWSRN